MSAIASIIIIPPSGSDSNRAAAGFRGEDSSRRVSAVQAIAPRREDVPHRQGAFYPDNSDRGQGRDNREVRQLAIRPGPQGGASTSSNRAVVVRTGTAHAGPRDFGGTPFTSIQFLAQVIGQSEEPFGGPLAFHPDGAALGSNAYRRAGAAPPHYAEQPTMFRVAI